MESQAAHGQSAIVVVPADDQVRAKLAIERALARHIENHDVDDVHVTEPVTMISVVQANIRKATNVAARFTGTLGALGIPILAVAEGSLFHLHNQRSVHKAGRAGCPCGLQPVECAVFRGRLSCTTWASRICYNFSSTR